MSQTNTLPRVQMQELGMYLTTIDLDYSPASNKEMAELITQHFNVLCLEEDIEHYEELAFHYNEVLNFTEDFELESRRQEYYDVTGLSLF